MRTAAILALAIIPFPALAEGAHAAAPSLPDMSKTPGPANPLLDQAKVCGSAFTTKAYRRHSKATRNCVLSRYGKPSSPFTYDHLVPLELGGADTCDNLWPEPLAEAKMKDKLEDAVRTQVCVCHRLKLGDGQELFRHDWSKAYALYVTPKGTPMCNVNRAG